MDKTLLRQQSKQTLWSLIDCIHALEDLKDQIHQLENIRLGDAANRGFETDERLQFSVTGVRNSVKELKIAENTLNAFVIGSAASVIKTEPRNILTETLSNGDV